MANELIRARDAVTDAVLWLVAFLFYVLRRAPARQLLTVPLPKRVRLKGLTEEHAHLNGFHASVLEGVQASVRMSGTNDSSVDGKWMAVQPDSGEVIFMHETEVVAIDDQYHAMYSSSTFAVLKLEARGYGMVAQRHIAQGEVVMEEAPLVVIRIDEADAEADPQLRQLNDDARTVLAIAQMRTGVAPAHGEWDSLPGMKPIADRIVELQCERSFYGLPEAKQHRWMALCDSLALHGRDEGSPAGRLHSNSFGSTSDGARLSVMYEVLSRANHSCGPNIDMDIDEFRGHTARIVALRDIASGVRTHP